MVWMGAKSVVVCQKARNLTEALPQSHPMVGIVCLGKPMLALFGPEFASGHNALRLLAMGQFVHAATCPVGYLMSLTGYQDTTAKILGYKGTCESAVTGTAYAVFRSTWFGAACPP